MCLYYLSNAIEVIMQNMGKKVCLPDHKFAQISWIQYIIIDDDCV